MDELVALVVLVALMGLAALAAVVAVAVIVARRLLVAASAGAALLALRATSYGAGRRSEIASLRLMLRSEVDAAHRAVDVARAQGWPIGDAPMLVARLEHAAAGIDARLRSLAADPRREAGRAALPALRTETDVVARSAGSLRDALLASASAVESEDLRALGADCAVEARALRAR